MDRPRLPVGPLMRHRQQRLSINTISAIVQRQIGVLQRVDLFPSVPVI